MNAWWLPSLAIAALIGSGALGSALGWCSPEHGFAVFGAGLGVAIFSLPSLAGAAAFASSTGKPWRSQAVRAAALPLLTVLVIVLPSLARLNPPIHDITTDPGDSLELPPEVAAQPNAVASEAPRADELALQREAYPDLAPLELALAGEPAFRAALAVAERMPRWQIQSQDPAAGLIQATARSRVFGFVDDVLIRVQAQGEGARVDMRSRSRFGQSDLGANAARIRDYLGRVREQAGRQQAGQPG